MRNRSVFEPVKNSERAPDLILPLEETTLL
jgi:hypothetical protein